MSDGLRREFQVDLRKICKSPQPRRAWDRRPMANIQYALVLGHQIRAALDAGEFQTYANVSRYIGLTEMRVSQVIGFTLLAPHIQHALLTFPKRVLWRIPERRLRPIIRKSSWEEQYRAWKQLLRDIGIDSPTARA